MELTQAQMAERHQHYQGLVEAYGGMIDAILIGLGNKTLDITGDQAKHILRTLRRGRSWAASGVELWSE